MIVKKLTDPLALAARANDFETVKALIDASDAKQRTRAFDFAVGHGNTEIAEYLSKCGLEENIDFEKYVYLAIESGEVSTIKFIYTLATPTADLETMWKRAFESNKVEMVQYLCENGFRIEDNGWAIEMTTRFARHNEIACYLVKVGYGIHHQNFRAFWWSVQNNNTEMIQFFIEHGARVDVSKNSLVRKEDLHNIPCFNILKKYPEKSVYEIVAELAQQAQSKPKSRPAKQLNELITSYSFLAKEA